MSGCLAKFASKGSAAAPAAAGAPAVVPVATGGLNEGINPFIANIRLTTMARPIKASTKLRMRKKRFVFFTYKKRFRLSKLSIRDGRLRVCRQVSEFCRHYCVP